MAAHRGKKSRLTREQWQEIARLRVETGALQKDLAAQFGVSEQSVSTHLRDMGLGVEVKPHPEAKEHRIELPRRIPDFMLTGRNACLDADPETFFPNKAPNGSKAAKEICAACPVTEECLAWALKYEDTGVWGGKSAAERRQMRREQVA